MRTILDSIRLIDKKLGGTVEADEGMRSLLDEIATLFHSGGGGGGSSFVVTFTENNGTWTADKTAKEVYEAFQDGLLPFARVFYDNGGSYSYYPYEFEYASKNDRNPPYVDEYSVTFKREGCTYDYGLSTLTWSKTEFIISNNGSGVESVYRGNNSWMWQ